MIAREIAVNTTPLQENDKTPRPEPDEDDEEAPETPPDEPEPMPIKEPPKEPGAKGPYVVRKAGVEGQSTDNADRAGGAMHATPNPATAGPRQSTPDDATADLLLARQLKAKREVVERCGHGTLPIETGG